MLSKRQHSGRDVRRKILHYGLSSALLISTFTVEEEVAIAVQGSEEPDEGEGT
jgi:hypothetical protein